MTPASKYRLGEISRDSKGIYWVQWYGEHEEQGGRTFKLGSLGSADIIELLALVSENMKVCEGIYSQQIENRENQLMRYQWKHKPTDKLVEVERRIKDSDIPPTVEEAAESQISEDEAGPENWTKFITGGIGTITYGRKGHW